MADPQSSQKDTPQLESLTLDELAFLSAFRTLPPEVQQALIEGLRRDDPKPLRPFRDQIRLWLSTWSRNLSDQPGDEIPEIPPPVERRCWQSFLGTRLGHDTLGSSYCA